jgi:hypothetical protein
VSGSVPWRIDLQVATVSKRMVPYTGCATRRLDHSATLDRSSSASAMCADDATLPFRFGRRDQQRRDLVPQRLVAEVDGQQLELSRSVHESELENVDTRRDEIPPLSRAEHGAVCPRVERIARGYFRAADATEDLMAEQPGGHDRLAPRWISVTDRVRHDHCGGRRCSSSIGRRTRPKLRSRACLEASGAASVLRLGPARIPAAGLPRRSAGERTCTGRRR